MDYGIQFEINIETAYIMLWMIIYSMVYTIHTFSTLLTLIYIYYDRDTTYVVYYGL